MNFIWELFEELDGLLYVSDIETNELVYMNAAFRNFLGYGSNDDYIGKKCYEVIQGKTSPCDFCTNKYLKPGKFITWTHKNEQFNKKYFIKDSMILDQERKYRIELAIDFKTQSEHGQSLYFMNNEKFLGECLLCSASAITPEESINRMIAYIGETFICERVYIFEIYDNNLMENTYEWCKEGIPPQKDIIQKESVDSIDWWIKNFKNNKMVIIEDMEDIKTSHPITYGLLKQQNISSLIVAPISADNKIIGFIGVDNPNKDMFKSIISFLRAINVVALSLLNRRESINYLKKMSFYDNLTGSLNRNALFEHHKDLSSIKSLGIIFCDISELKYTNDTLGHEEGDKLIQYCYKLLKDTLETDNIYRLGGDEFVAVFKNINKENLEKIAENLKNRIKEDKNHMAVGYSWSNKAKLDLEKIILSADKSMYKDKQEYYEMNRGRKGIDRRADNRTSSIRKNLENKQSEFSRFIANTYYDTESFFESISQKNTTSYYYFGDMQKNIFYISDDMRDDFGFSSNIVSDLFTKWSKHISTPKSKEIFWNDMESMLKNKCIVHDRRYQVTNVEGKCLWIRCYGIMKWNEDKSKPLFFSGRISYQDEEFVIDPITNLPREAALIKLLNEKQNTETPFLCIGFNLNNITEFNHIRGRTYVNHFLKKFGYLLNEKLLDKMFFYRLEGMRFVAIVNPNCKDSKDILIEQIRNIAKDCYKAMDFYIRIPCSFAIMKYPLPPLSPEDFLEQIASLIKIAKNKTNKPFIDYSSANIQSIKKLSNKSLTLINNVYHEMENFRIVIQPIVLADNAKIIGGEVLLRWNFEGKDISPDIFIPMLEKEGIIDIVGKWVFEQTVRVCKRMIAYIPDFYLSFNVSIHQIKDNTFIEWVKEVLDTYKLNTSHLVAEITESSLDENPESLKNFLTDCRILGLKTALDDFGSGYSSMRMLLHYTHSFVKLDRSLLNEITASKNNLNFIKSIIYSCHQFGMKVCVEGVETDTQNNLIKDLECDYIQGYYYHKPIEVSALYYLLNDCAN